MDTQQHEATMSKQNERQVGGDHYKQLDPEPWDVMENWNPEHFVGFLRYSAMKRIARWESKDNAIQECEKAAHELLKCAEVMRCLGSAKLSVADYYPHARRRQTDDDGEEIPEVPR